MSRALTDSERNVIRRVIECGADLAEHPVLLAQIPSLAVERDTSDYRDFALEFSSPDERDGGDRSGWGPCATAWGVASDSVPVELVLFVDGSMRIRLLEAWRHGAGRTMDLPSPDTVTGDYPPSSSSGQAPQHGEEKPNGRR